MLGQPTIFRSRRAGVLFIAASMACAITASGFAQIGLTDARACNAAWISGGNLQFLHRDRAGGLMRNGPVKVELRPQPTAISLDSPRWWVEDVLPRVAATDSVQTPIRLHRAALPLWPVLVISVVAGLVARERPARRSRQAAI